MRRSIWIAGLLALLMFQACGVAKAKRPPPTVEVADEDKWKDVQTIAVLPPAINTSDLSLGYNPWYRAIAMRLLEDKGWKTVSISAINKQLNKWDLILIEELSDIETDEVCTKLICDAVLHWELTNSEFGLIINLILRKKDGTALWQVANAHENLDYNLEKPTKDRLINLKITGAFESFPEKQ